MQIILVYRHAKKFCLMEGTHFSPCGKASFANSSQYCEFINVSSSRTSFEFLVMSPSFNSWAKYF